MVQFIFLLTWFQVVAGISNFGLSGGRKYGVVHHEKVLAQINSNFLLVAIKLGQFTLTIRHLELFFDTEELRELGETECVPRSSLFLQLVALHFGLEQSQFDKRVLERLAELVKQWVTYTDFLRLVLCR